MFADNSPYEVVIEATVAEYGVSVRSDPLELYFTNPCDNTNILPETIQDIVYRLEADEVTQAVPLFRDSVSDSYGSVPLCGPLTYSLYKKSNGGQEVVEFAKLV